MTLSMTAKKFALAALAVATIVTGTAATHDTAEAKPKGAFIAGAIIGGTAGLIAGSAYGHGYYGYRPAYYGGYYGPSRRVCEWRARYNKWGHYVGTKRVCWRVAYY